MIKITGFPFFIIKESEIRFNGKYSSNFDDKFNTLPIKDLPNLD